ncbi:MAG: peptidoglycan editing factor PgeF [Smithella sp.]
MFKYVRKNSIPHLQAEVFSECDFLTHAFCTRQGGGSRDEYSSLNMSFREGDEELQVMHNWGKMAGSFAIPIENFLVLNQVHGDDILIIKSRESYFSSGDALNYDAIITNRSGLALCIKTADCVPVFIIDKKKKVIAAVHAGWKGTALGITAKVIQLMKSQYGSNPQDILAAVGPSIGFCCYEVDSIVADAFAEHKGKKNFLFQVKGKNKWMLDLPEANHQQILECDVPETNIELSGLCTKCNQDLFFSHRGSGGITGRQINFLMLKEVNQRPLATINNKIFWRN